MLILNNGGENYNVSMAGFVSIGFSEVIIIPNGSKADLYMASSAKLCFSNQIKRAHQMLPNMF